MASAVKTEGIAQRKERFCFSFAAGPFRRSATLTQAVTPGDSGDVTFPVFAVLLCFHSFFTYKYTL